MARKQNPLTVTPLTLAALGAGGIAAYYFYDKAKKAEDKAKKLESTSTGRGGTVKKPSTPYDVEKASDKTLSVSVTRDENGYYDVSYDDKRIVGRDVSRGDGNMDALLTVSRAKLPFRIVVSGPPGDAIAAEVRPGEAEIQDVSSSSALFMARTLTEERTDKEWVDAEGNKGTEDQEASIAAGFTSPEGGSGTVFFKIVE